MGPDRNYFLISLSAPSFQINDHISTAQMGKAAEHMVCLDLITKGINASICPDGHSSYDVLIEHPTTHQPMRIQVKSCAGISKSNQTRHGEKYHPERFLFSIPNSGKYLGKIEIFAFVALGENIVRYYKVNEVIPCCHYKCFTAHKFRDDTGSLERALSNDVPIKAQENS